MDPSDDIATGSGKNLSTWVDATDAATGVARSTNFRRPEDIHEDPNKPGTFYLVSTGRNEKVPGTTIEDNAFGKLHRLRQAQLWIRDTH